MKTFKNIEELLKELTKQPTLSEINLASGRNKGFICGCTDLDGIKEDVEGTLTAMHEDGMCLAYLMAFLAVMCYRAGEMVMSSDDLEMRMQMQTIFNAIQEELKPSASTDPNDLANMEPANDKPA